MSNRTNLTKSNHKPPTPAANKFITNHKNSPGLLDQEVFLRAQKKNLLLPRPEDSTARIEELPADSYFSFDDGNLIIQEAESKKRKSIEEDDAESIASKRTCLLGEQQQQQGIESEKTSVVKDHKQKENEYGNGKEAEKEDEKDKEKDKEKEKEKEMTEIETSGDKENEQNEKRREARINECEMEAAKDRELIDKMEKVAREKKENLLKNAELIGEFAADLLLKDVPDVPASSRACIVQDLKTVCAENNGLLEEIVTNLRKESEKNGDKTNSDYMQSYIETVKEQTPELDNKESRRNNDFNDAKTKREEDHDKFYRDSIKHDFGNNVVNLVVDLFVNPNKMTAGERRTFQLIISAVDSVMQIAAEKYWMFMSQPENLADQTSLLKMIASLVYSNFGEYAKQIFDPSSGTSGLKHARCYVLVLLIFWFAGRTIKAYQSNGGKKLTLPHLVNISTQSSLEVQQRQQQQYPPQQEFFLPGAPETVRQNIQSNFGGNNLMQQNLQHMPATAFHRQQAFYPR